MKNKIIVLIVMVFSILLFGCSQSEKKSVISNNKIKEVSVISKEKNSINVSVNPNMELLSIVQYLGENNRGIMTKYSFDYKHSIDQYFKNFKNHEAVKFMDKLIYNEFAYDAPPATMLYLDKNFNLKEGLQYSQYLIDRAKGEANLNKLAQLLKEFYIDTNFHEFYRENSEYYNKIIDKTLVDMGDRNYVKELEDYYGKNQNSYNVILVSLFHHGGFGPKVEVKENQYDIYSITGPSGSEEDKPVFGSEEEFKYLQRHEFSHSFVNYLGERYKDSLNEYSKLFNVIKEEMSRQAYSNWITSVNEHIVRAITTRMAYSDSEEEGEKALQGEKGRQFIYIDELVKKLNEYENNREKYTTFEEFYLELIKAFDNYLNNQEALSQLKKSTRNIYNVLINGSEKIIVIPTNEKNENASIKESIGKIPKILEEKIECKTKIITDKEALEMDLSNSDLIIYGTMEGNKLLSKYKEKFDFEVKENSINLEGKEYTGDKIQFITVVDNPENSKKAFIIYTANNEKYVSGTNSHFAGPSAYHLFVEDKEVIAGYYKEIKESKLK